MIGRADIDYSVPRWFHIDIYFNMSIPLVSGTQATFMIGRAAWITPTATSLAEGYRLYLRLCAFLSASTE